MLENEFHKLEEKQEIRTTISQIRKEIKKQDSKKHFWNCSPEKSP